MSLIQPDSCSRSSRPCAVSRALGKTVAVLIIRGALVVAFYVSVTSSLQHPLNSVYLRLRKIVKFCTRRIRGDVSVHSVNNDIRLIFVVPVSLFKHEGVLRVAIV